MTLSVPAVELGLCPAEHLAPHFLRHFNVLQTSRNTLNRARFGSCTDAALDLSRERVAEPERDEIDSTADMPVGNPVSFPNYSSFIHIDSLHSDEPTSGK